METVILYGSCYGTARRYAEELGRLTGYPAYPADRAPSLEGVRRVVHLGGLYAGSVRGLKHALRAMPEEAGLWIVTVGIGDPRDPKNAEHVRASLQSQLPPGRYDPGALFLLRGAMDYSRLKPVHRLMMRMLCRSLRARPESEKSADDRMILESYGGKVDFTDLSALIPLAELLQSDTK